LGDSTARRSSDHCRSLTLAQSLRETTNRHLGSSPRKLCTRTGEPRPMAEQWRERAREAMERESLPTGAVEGSVAPEGSGHRPSSFAVCCVCAHLMCVCAPELQSLTSRSDHLVCITLTLKRHPASNTFLPPPHTTLSLSPSLPLPPTLGQGSAPCTHRTGAFSVLTQSCCDT
jgi:hypothetical protein